MYKPKKRGRFLFYLLSVHIIDLVKFYLIHLGTNGFSRETHMFVLLFVGIAARETAQALKTLAQAARGVAASTTDPKAAAAMLDSARDVMEGSALLIHEAKQALISPGDTESQQMLAQVRALGFHRGSVVCFNVVLFHMNIDMWKAQFDVTFEFN